MAAGLVATGSAAATYYHHTQPGPPSAAYGAATYDHADPYHSEPGGEWIRIEAAPTIGTAPVNHNILGPGD